jgi:hypothetical protein
LGLAENPHRHPLQAALFCKDDYLGTESRILIKQTLDDEINKKRDSCRTTVERNVTSSGSSSNNSVDLLLESFMLPSGSAQTFLFRKYLSRNWDHGRILASEFQDTQ